MKTQNLNTGTITGRMIIILIALMISPGVFAQNSLKSFNSKNYTENIFGSKNQIINALNSSGEKKAFYEEEIQLEEWMINLEKWAERIDSISPSTHKTTKRIEEKNDLLLEEDMEIEHWMIDYKWFQQESFTENELILEEWMNYPKMWNIYACN